MKVFPFVLTVSIAFALSFSNSYIVSAQTTNNIAKPKLLKDIYNAAHFTNTESANVDKLIATDSLIYFEASDSSDGSLFVEGAGLWRSDGTDKGTFRVFDYVKGSDGSFSLYPETMVASGEHLYFMGIQNETGLVEAWRTDGTIVGTVKMYELPSESSLCFGTEGHVASTKGLAVAECTSTSAKLWLLGKEREAATLLGEFPTQAKYDLISIKKIIAIEDGFTFITFSDVDPANPDALELPFITQFWVSDGTPTGTIELPFSTESVVDMSATKRHLFYSTYASFERHTLWGVDRNDYELRQLTDDGATQMSQLTTAGDRIFITDELEGTNESIWTSDGTITGTMNVSAEGQSLVGIGGIPNLVVKNGTVYFSTLNAATSQRENLWMSNGTITGTVKLSDFGAYNLQVGIEKLFFFAREDSLGRQIWVSDFTAQGTQIVDKPFEDNLTEGVRTTAVLQDVLYFSYDDGQRGRELWQTDGTIDGTRIVKDINTQSRSASRQSLPPHSLTLGADSHIYFVADDGQNGSQIWKTDGTSEGTTMLINQDLSRGWVAIGDLTWGNELLYFTAIDPDDAPFSPNTRWLWRSDGTDEGTFKLYKYEQGPSDITYLNDTLYYFAGDNTASGLWATQGTIDTTLQIMPFDDGSFFQPDPETTPIYKSGPTQITKTDNLLYFVADDATGAGSELWVSDGTTAGTRLFKDVNPGPQTGWLFHLISAGSRLYFLSFNNMGVGSLWITDGTDTGTVRLAEFPDVIPFQEVLVSPTVLGETLYFGKRNSTGDAAEIWRTDGTPGGTRLLENFATYRSSNDPHRPETYQFTSWGGGTNLVGSYQGTVPSAVWYLEQSTEIFYPLLFDGTYDAEYRELTPNGGKLAYTRFTESTGRELWMLDSKGCRLIVDDLNPGAASAYPTELLFQDDILFFVADDGIHGMELHSFDTAGELGCQPTYLPLIVNY